MNKAEKRNFIGSLSIGLPTFLFLSLMAAFIHVKILAHYWHIDDIGINNATRSMELMYFVLPWTFLKFSVFSSISFVLIRLYLKLQIFLFYLIPLLLFIIFFLLNLDFYHWTVIGEVISGTGEEINRSVFWTHIF